MIERRKINFIFYIVSSVVLGMLAYFGVRFVTILDKFPVMIEKMSVFENDAKENKKMLIEMKAQIDRMAYKINHLSRQHNLPVVYKEDI